MLPESVAGMAELFSLHAAAGPEAHFATRQLLLIGSRCLDLADSAGRKAAADMLQNILLTVPCSWCVWPFSSLRLGHQGCLYNSKILEAAWFSVGF